MLHDRHNLDCVVAVRSDHWEDIAGEFLVGVKARLNAGHADVAFVDEEAAIENGSGMAEHIGIRRVPKDAVEVEIVGVLVGEVDPSGNAADGFAIRENEMTADFAVVGN